MFDALSEKLNAVFGRLTGKGRLTERDVDEGLREVRLAMLEADVNFRVARDFVQKVRERAVGSEVLEHLSPGQQIVKIVNEELVGILGGESSRLNGSDRPPAVLMLVGLQGSGKTTTAAKLALHLKRGGHKVLLVAGDMRRPAAVEQLETLGKQLDVAVHSVAGATALQACRSGLQKAADTGATWVILDTGGRLHVDDEMMEELEEIKEVVSPHETLMVVDAMTGQDAVNSAQSFHARIQLTGLIMTKLDGDARGGAALSITQVTGLPIKFIGTGERTGALEAFHPDRMASRILGMGDVSHAGGEGAGVHRRGAGQGAGAQAEAGNLQPGRLSRAAAAGKPHGANQPGAGDDPGLLVPFETDVTGGAGRQALEDLGSDRLLHDPQGAAQS